MRHTSRVPFSMKALDSRLVEGLSSFGVVAGLGDSVIEAADVGLGDGMGLDDTEPMPRRGDFGAASRRFKGSFLPEAAAAAGAFTEATSTLRDVQEIIRGRVEVVIVPGVHATCKKEISTARDASEATVPDVPKELEVVVQRHLRARGADGRGPPNLRSSQTWPVSVGISFTAASFISASHG